MFTHIGAITLAPDTTDVQREAIAQAFRDMVGVVPGLERARVAVDSKLREGNCDVMFVLDFDTEESWRVYPPHEAHQAIVRDHLADGRMIGKTFFQAPDGDFV